MLSFTQFKLKSFNFFGELYFNLYNKIIEVFSTYDLVFSLQNSVKFSSTYWIKEIFFNSSIIMLLFLGIIFYVATYGLKLIGNVNSNFDIFFDFYSFLNEVEEEIGAIDDLLVYISVYALIIVWFFLLTLFGGFIFRTFAWVISLLNLVVIIGILFPFFVLKTFGLPVFSYIRGSGKTSSLLFEALLDLISTSVILLRFFIQNVRFILVFMAFFELYEFIYFKLVVNLNYGCSLKNLFFGDKVYVNWYWYEILLDVFLNLFLYLYYVGHLIFISLAQITAYFALCFWLLLFLYTTFCLETHEKYFFFKRLQI